MAASTKPGPILSGMSNISTTGPAAGILPMGSGGSWGGSMPLSTGPAAHNFYSTLPTSAEDSRRKATRVYSGQSQTNNTVTIGTAVAPWKETHWENELFEGQMLFGFRGSPKEPARPIANIRQLNTLLRAKFFMADEMVKTAISRGGGFEGVLETADIEYLKSIPVKTWRGFSKLDDTLGSDIDAGRSMAFLSRDTILGMWNFIGFALGQINPDADIKVLTIARSGMLESIENIWGVDATAGKRLFIVFKRVKLQNGKYGPYQWVPWSGHDEPPQSFYEYDDYSGFTEYGVVMELGSCIWWRSKRQLTSHDLREDVGLIDPRDGKTFTRTSYGESRALLRPRRGRRTYYCL